MFFQLKVDEVQCQRNYLEDDYDNFDFEEEERGPALEIYGTDLTLLARQGLLEDCFGRERELFEMMEILVRRQKNNPVLVGDAGVGKTAIIELFASKIVNNLTSDVHFDGNEIQLKLQKAILLLPEKQQLVFKMKYFEEIKYEQMSEILGTSVGALKASYHHAVKKVEDFLNTN